jgi:succinylglutamate desuccinylase
MMENIIELNSGQAGPTSIILAGVHGNEKCGVAALKKIIPSLRLEKGRVFVGYGNPLAIEQDVRFTEMNLNRAFKPDNLIPENDKKTYEYQRAQFLKKYLDLSDNLLDLHASCSVKSQKFIICENNAREIIKYLPIEIVVSGFDRIEPGGTDSYMNSLGKIGICVECGYLGDSASVKVALDSVMKFLSACGHITGSLSKSKKTYIKMNEIYFTKTFDFRLVRDFADFEAISAGQIIGIDGEEEIRAKNDGIILFARNRSMIGDEAFLLGEYEKTQ